jgi:transaldolase / glucose-6-phosphate isomerase
MTTNRLVELAKLGQSVWIDFISREALRSGELARYVESGVLGLTSNPAIFEKSMAGGALYDADIRRLAAEGKNTQEIFDIMSRADIADAATLLRPVYDKTDALDGYVSIEVNPHLAHGTEETLAEAKRLWAALSRPNIFVKIPGTPAGVPAIRDSIAAGININVTLLFSIEAYEASAYAYIEGLEERAAKGQDIRKIASVASFFVSRVDTLVDKQLTNHPDAKSLAGKAAVANAKLAYERFGQIFSGPRWEKMVTKGARVQRPLWASTSTKDPSYPDTIYVDELIGPHTVNTMPPQTVDAFMNHGTVARTVDVDVDKARAELAALANAGIDMNAVTDELLHQGVKLFAEAFDRLEAGLAKKVDALVKA